MIAVDVVAAGAVSALGRGREAYASLRREPEGRTSAQPSALRLDSELSERGAKHALVGRVATQHLEPASADRATELLAVAARELREELALRFPDFGQLRLIALIGTSAGGMPSIEQALAARASGSLSKEVASRANYTAPTRVLGEILGLPDLPVLSILAACASATLAVGLGARLLEARQYDLVIAGGYDALSHFVYSGFESLGALSRSQPRPFCEQRDGMALGEGAALVALCRPGAGGQPLGRVFGFGASCDAQHVTAPDPAGAGLARAARAALQDAALSSQELGWLSAHATSTVLNDAAESAAIRQLFDGSSASPPVSAWKAVVGHTLGAAGLLEALAAWDALDQEVFPATPLEEPTLPGVAGGELRSLPGPCLKLSAAFGGCNAALVLGAPQAASLAAPRVRHPVRVRQLGPLIDQPDLARALALAPHRAEIVGRADRGSELTLTAAAAALETLGPLPEAAAVIVATYTASLEVDELFDQRRRANKPVEPRRFPATSPNLGAGLCSIAFGLKGPSFAVSCEPDQGLGAYAWMLAQEVVATEAPAALLIFVEDVGPVVRDLLRAAGHPERPLQARAVILERGSPLEPELDAFWERWPAA